MTSTTIRVDQLLDSQFPGRECSLETATQYLKELFADHTVVNMHHGLWSTDGDAIELYFKCEIRLRDNRVVFVYASAWYNGGNPQEGVDLIKNFNLLNYCESIATSWLDQ